MESNGGERPGISGNDTAKCSDTTVEIKIKMLDSQTFTLRVDKCVPVPELKQQIASVTGVLSEHQRLICRGKVLKDDQLLSAYYVEDGHTLHLVVRQPVDSSPGSSNHPETGPTSSIGHNPGHQVGPSVMVGSFDISEHGDGTFPDLNRIVSAVLNSFGVTRSGSGGEGIDLNQPPLDRLSAAPGLIGTRNYSRLHSDQAASVAIPVESLQAPIIPDSLTTLLQYSSHLRQEFLSNAGGHSANAQNSVFSGSDGPELEAAARPSRGRGILTPESLSEVMSSVRRLLVEQATGCLSQLAGQLESQSSVMDPLERSRIQSNAMTSGALFHNFGALFLELGRAIMTLRMGQTPGDAFVNAGPSMFVSSTGPNPIMVQSLPFVPGALNSIPVGPVQHGAGVVGDSTGSGFVPRNIDIRIRAGSVLTRREPSSSQSVGQGAVVSSGAENSDQQDASADPNLHREPQVRAVPLRTIVAAVPASVARLDSSRGPVGILYPVLARVQHVSSGNSIGTGASHVPGQLQESNGITEQPSATQQPNFVIPERNGNSGLSSGALNDQGFFAHMRGGLEHLLSTLFPGEHVFNNSAVPGSGPGSVPSQSGTPQNIDTAQESSPAVSNEGIILSNILRQIMPVISQYNSGADVNDGDTQADDNQGDGGSSSCCREGDQPEPSSKRQRRD